MLWKCDICGAEFELDDFPEGDFSCPSCGADNGMFSLQDFPNL